AYAVGNGYLEVVYIDILQHMGGAIMHLHAPGGHLRGLAVHGSLRNSHVFHGAAPYQRRSKRRRSRMAMAFITIRNSSRTMIAPDARSIKAGSARVVQL